MISRRELEQMLGTALLWTGATLLLGALLAASRTGAAYCVFLVPPVLVLALVLFARLELDFGPPTLPKGELDRLIVRKNQGVLFDRPRRIRDTTAQTHLSIPNTGYSTVPVFAHPAISESILDRLVRAKRNAGRMK